MSVTKRERERTLMASKTERMPVPSSVMPATNDAAQMVVNAASESRSRRDALRASESRPLVSSRMEATNATDARRMENRTCRETCYKRRHEAFQPAFRSDKVRSRGGRGMLLKDPPKSSKRYHGSGKRAC